MMGVRGNGECMGHGVAGSIYGDGHLAWNVWGIVECMGMLI
jgi:hypothetical protein